MALDRIYVYRLTDRADSGPSCPISVMGAVARPGFYLLRNEAVSVGTSCKLAGGVDRFALRDLFMVWRRKGNHFEAVPFQEESARDLAEIFPGDILWIPERNFPHLMGVR